MPVCKKCGNEYDESLSVCPNCGEPFTPVIPEETFDMYQELLSSSDTKEFVMPSEIIEAMSSDTLPDLSSEESEPEPHDNNIREQMVREMYAEEPEEPGFLDKMQTSVSSLFSSIRKNISSARISFSNSLSANKKSSSKEDEAEEDTSDETLSDDTEPTEASNEIQESLLPVDETVTELEESSDFPDVEDTEDIEDTVTDDSLLAESVDNPDLYDAADPLDTVSDQSSESTENIEALYEEENDLAALFNELSDEPSFEVGFMPSTSGENLSKAYQVTEPAEATVTLEAVSEESTTDNDSETDETLSVEPETVSSDDLSAEETSVDSLPYTDDDSEASVNEMSSVDSILEGLREGLETDLPAEESAQTENAEVEEHEEVPAVSDDITVTDKEGTSNEAPDKKSRLLRKKGLGKAAVLGLALLAILSMLGVLFLWIIPQKRAEQQAIEERENAYLDFLCDTWMSDVFIYADQIHPSREVLTLNKDYTYRCDIWTSSSDREAFDPEIWSITDTNEGTYYLELDTASIRIYYTGDDGEDYVYRRYIRQLDDNVLVLREYYNETLSEYYDVTFSKYTEAIS